MPLPEKFYKSPRKVVGWVRRFLGGMLSPASIAAVLERAQQQVEQRRKFRREFCWIWDAENQAQARDWARRFCARWQWATPEMVEKLQLELEDVLAFFAFPAQWRHRLRTTNLGEGWFKHLRRYLSRFPGCRDAQHSEHVLGCLLLAAESMHR